MEGFPFSGIFPYVISFPGCILYNAKYVHLSIVIYMGLITETYHLLMWELDFWKNRTDEEFMKV